MIEKLFKLNICEKHPEYCSIEYLWDNIWSIPEFAILKTCNQNPKWHGEGNVMNHTALVIKHALQIVNNDMTYDGIHINGYFDAESNHKRNEFETVWLDKKHFNDTLILLTAALFHDIGKGVTTKIGKDGNYHSYNHEFEGEKLTRLLLWDENIHFREAVCSLVKYHMMPLSLFNSKDYLEKIVQISHNVPSWELLLKLKSCDLEGSLQEDNLLKERDTLYLSELADITTNINFKGFPSKKHYGTKFYERNTKKPLDIYILIGLSGAGKNTFINNIFEDDVVVINGKVIKKLDKDNTAVISRDDIRVKLGYCSDGEKIVGTSEQENKVSEIFNEEVLSAAKEGKIIIINNINLKKEYRTQITNMFSNYNLTINYVYIQANKLQKNIDRREGQMNSDSIIRQIKNFDWPDFYEYDNFYILTN